MTTICHHALAETTSVEACPVRRSRAPIDVASLLIALALVADALAGQDLLRSPTSWLLAGAYLGAVALAAWARRLVEPLAISGVLLPLALGDVSTRLIATACVLAAILASVVLVRRRTRKAYDSPPSILLSEPGAASSRAIGSAFRAMRKVRPAPGRCSTMRRSSSCLAGSESSGLPGSGAAA
jgi:hypothetical protein